MHKMDRQLTVIWGLTWIFISDKEESIQTSLLSIIDKDVGWVKYEDSGPQGQEIRKT